MSYNPPQQPPYPPHGQGQSFQGQGFQQHPQPQYGQQPQHQYPQSGGYMPSPGAPQQQYPPAQSGGYVQGPGAPQQQYPPPQPGGYNPNPSAPQQQYPPPQPSGYVHGPGAPQQQHPPPQPGGYNPNLNAPQQGYHQPQHVPYGQQPYAPQGQYPQSGPNLGAHAYAPPPMPASNAPGHAPQYAHPQQPQLPSLGYDPNAIAMGDYTREADSLRRAMKGFGTDDKTLIMVLAPLDPLQMAAVRAAYSKGHRRDLHKDIESETSGHFEEGLLAIVDGPLQYDANSTREAVKGVGTKEWILNDVLLGRSNADIHAIKTAYEHSFHRSLVQDVKDDLSMKTADLFTAVLRGNRQDEHAPINHQTIESSARAIHETTAGRVVNDATEICAIFARSSDAELRAINHAFQERYHLSLEKHIKECFSGHLEDALVHILRSATDPVMRDACLINSCIGSADELLVSRIVRLHWNRPHMNQVKLAYRHKFGKDLVSRVRSEVEGDCGRLLVALLG
ncbi:annexin ANXC3.2 [Penicillium pulvis]|uniref:annexin ANXC3.2 n=1 Tax=Penicillium pulvis TaxID=1562058 RepID=UPI002546D0A7|nr:annexin ANXC3.2 [Penicillium pulvis]KAJ5797883.1 annexin ANXC3.2 [Penicillium pulvis]